MQYNSGAGIPAGRAAAARFHGQRRGDPRRRRGDGERPRRNRGGGRAAVRRDGSGGHPWPTEDLPIASWSASHAQAASPRVVRAVALL